MLYVVQLEDGDETLAVVMSASDDGEIAILAEQWRDRHEWESAVVWKSMRIWRLGEEISTKVKVGKHRDDYLEEE